MLSNSYFILNPIFPISGLSNEILCILVAKALLQTQYVLNSIALISGLSIEILCILVAQETAKLPNVKVGGL